MNKIAPYLQEHLDGEVLTSTRARQYYSKDASVLHITPLMAVYPRNKNDVRKTARFTWQLAEKGHVLPITARGRGTDLGGAAIGNGIVMVFPAHMNRMIEMDSKQQLARIQPGMSFRAFQESMESHGLFLPSYPASYDFSTIGGAIANNSSGEKTFKYGSTREWIDQLEVVLADGELIHTGRLSKRELNAKKGLQTMEGEIYRQLDGLITDNWDMIQSHSTKLRTSKNSSGYDLADVKQKDGSFDLTPLFVGSQGTLGIITESIVKLAPYSVDKELLVVEFDSLESAHDAITAIMKLKPSAMEMVDDNLLEFVSKHNPKQLKGLVSEDTPTVVLLVEFDDLSERARRKNASKAEKLVKSLARKITRSSDDDEQRRLWAIRHSAATVTNYNADGKSSVPVIEDGVVPHEAFQEYIEGVYELLKKHHLEVALWGHAGDANLHMQPLVDLSKLGDRQKIFKLMNDYYQLVIKLGGSIAAEHNDGRIRAPFLELQHGKEIVDLYAAVKKIFDPYGTLNPDVKQPTDIRDLVPMLRHEYTLEHLADHLPKL